MHLPTIFKFLPTLLLTFGLVNCNHYSVIPTNKTPFKSVYLHAISNQDYAPNIHTLFQNQIRYTFLKDSRLSLAKNQEESDAQLYVTIDDYRRNVNTRSSEDPGRYNSLNLGLEILVSLYDNNSKEYLVKNISLYSNEHLFFDHTKDNIAHREIEYELLPKITRELSEDILNLVLDDWPTPVD